MFDKLVVSTAQRRRGRTAKFVVCTSFVYLSAVAFAFAASIFFATPRLADTSSRILEGLVVPIARTTQTPRDTQRTAAAPTLDPRNVQALDKIIDNLGKSRPVVPNSPPVGTGIEGGPDVQGERGSGIPGIPESTGRDFISSNLLSEPPRPEPQKPPTRPVDNSKPMPVSSTVLQGKAIERVVPVYPELPKRIRLGGDVSLEVIISPEGRVESVRVVSGHPMLVNAARDAARGWRFEPTLLNGVPVRVTGVITFVFKLSE